MVITHHLCNIKGRSPKLSRSGLNRLALSQNGILVRIKKGCRAYGTAPFFPGANISIMAKDRKPASATSYASWQGRFSGPSGLAAVVLGRPISHSIQNPLKLHTLRS